MPERLPPAPKSAGRTTIPAPAATTPHMRSCRHWDMTRFTMPERLPPAPKSAGRTTIPAPAVTTPPIGSLTRWDMPMKLARLSPPARRRGIPCIPAPAARPAIPTPSFPAAATGTANGRRTATARTALIVVASAATTRARQNAKSLNIVCGLRTQRTMFLSSAPSAARPATARD